MVVCIEGELDRDYVREEIGCVSAVVDLSQRRKDYHY